MRVQSALLCDAASVREGLLHVLGGGLTYGVRPSFPAPFGVYLAVVCETEQQDLGRRVELKVVVVHVDANEPPIFELDGDLGVQLPPDNDERVPMLLPIVIDLSSLAVSEKGVYAVQMFCDGKLGADLRISMHAESPPTPVG